MMSKPSIRNTRSSSRLGDQIHSENCSHLSEKPATRATPGSVLGDITNQANVTSNAAKSGLHASKSARPGSALISSSRPPLPEASRFTPRIADMMHLDNPASSPAHVEEGMENPQYVAEYVQDIYAYLREEEEVEKLNPEYMQDQTEINPKMRGILVDWLVEVHLKYKLRNETLFLSAKLIDLVLSKRRVARKKLQLVGVACTLVSAKYEEMYVPELRDLTYICDGAYTEDKILRMEENILKTLNYNVTVPTPHTFLIRFLKAAHADKLMAQLACFLLDGTLLTLENLTCVWRPSQLAAAAILLARRQLGRHNWSPTLVNYSLYREEDVLPVARALLRNKRRLERNPDLMALAKKYSKTKYGKVSHISFLPLEYEEPPPSEDSSVDDSEAHEAW